MGRPYSKYPACFFGYSQPLTQRRGICVSKHALREWQAGRYLEEGGPCRWTPRAMGGFLMDFLYKSRPFGEEQQHHTSVIRSEHPPGKKRGVSRRSRDRSPRRQLDACFHLLKIVFIFVFPPAGLKGNQFHYWTYCMCFSQGASENGSIA